MCFNFQPYLNIGPTPVIKKQKLEITIDNRRGDIKNINKNNSTDELEAYGYITVESIKKWLINSYIDMDYLQNILIKNDLINSNFSEQHVINLILNFLHLHY